MNKIIVVEGHDPAFNLALEETLFDGLTPGGPNWILIWQNRPSVIIGRHQNTLEEIDQDYVREHKIDIIRRPSGGGAVYHDLGNVNFSFLFHREQVSLELAEVLRPILQALKSLDLPAELSGRNDIVVDGKKISGCAMRQQNGKHLVHGTLMLDLDLDQLGKCLKGNPDKYQSKGIASVRARVANLREFLPQGFSREQGVRTLTQALLAQWPEQAEPLPEEIRTAAEDLADKKFRNWDWNYGHSPKFDFKNRRRFPWGAMEYRVRVERGLITSWTLHGDFFSLKPVEDLERAMPGVVYKAESIKARLAELEAQTWFAGADKEQLFNFFSDCNI